MEHPGQSPAGFVVRCDPQAVVQEILYDTLGVHHILVLGRSITQLVAPADLEKMLNFLAALRTHETVLDWELHVSVAGQGRTLHFAGLRHGAQWLIIGSPSNQEMHRLSEQMRRSHTTQHQAGGQTITPPNQRRHLHHIELYNELSRLNNDMVTLQRALVKKNTKLEHSNAQLEQFAYVVSHDLQEPLRMITSYLTLLEKRYRDQLDSDAREFIDYAVDGAARMRHLIDDLLHYSRLTTQAKPAAPTDCNVVLQDVLRDLQAAIQDQQATITFDQLPTLRADPVQLRQLLQNLVGNALKFRGQEAPRVHIAAAAQGKTWLFSVSDNGIGLDPHQSERIFEMFQRLHTRHEYPGTGIGLAMCKKIVEGHGGRIWVESQPGQGATFSFILPQADDE